MLNSNVAVREILRMNYQRRLIETNANNKISDHFMKNLDNHTIVVQQLIAGVDRLLVRARVVKNHSSYEALRTTSKWKNFKQFIKRFFERGIRDVRVRLSVNGWQFETHTNRLGYIDFDIVLPKKGFQTVEQVQIQIDTLPAKTMYLNSYTENARYGVISDIDDTVLVSHSTKWYRSLWLLLSANEATRMPFDGVSGLYNRLHRAGFGLRGRNPFYYVSSSKWSLYELIHAFFRIQSLPEGHFLLNEHKAFLFTLSEFRDRLIGGKRHFHKLKKIETVLSLYPDLTFVLLGDSGQHDAEIYYRAALQNPDRIKIIYIRHVRRGREQKVKNLCSLLKEKTGIDMILVNDSHQVYKDACVRGLLPEVEVETEEEQSSNQARW